MGQGGRRRAVRPSFVPPSRHQPAIRAPRAIQLPGGHKTAGQDFVLTLDRRSAHHMFSAIDDILSSLCDTAAPPNLKIRTLQDIGCGWDVRRTNDDRRRFRMSPTTHHDRGPPQARDKPAACGVVGSDGYWPGVQNVGAPVNTLQVAGLPVVRIMPSTRTLSDAGTNSGYDDPPPMIFPALL